MKSAPRNSWYAGAHSSEVTNKPVGRTIFGKPVVMFRKANGNVAALHDRCPHRGVPLSMGRVKGDALECGYHGARFDDSGTCISKYAAEMDARHCQIASYRVLEKYGFVWVWVGDANKVTGEETLPPFLDVIDDPSSAVSDGGYPSMKASYLLIVDNLLDASHAEFVHSTTLGYDGMSEMRDPSKSKFELFPSDTGMRFNVIQEGDRAGQAFHDAVAKSLGEESHPDPIDWKVKVHWQAPGAFRYNSHTKLPGAPDETALQQHTIHVITPETETTCHYFVKQVEVQEEGKPKLNDFWTEATFMAFDEDKAIIEAQQEGLGKLNKLNNPAWTMYESDQLSIMGRQIIDGMIKADTATPAVATE